ncbi:MAG: class I SAM-dependent methyltransferase [Devosia sp.]
MTRLLPRSFGREAFGLDPANYHAARPAYPEPVWQALRERAGLAAGIEMLEIGAGTGLATEPLLLAKPKRLVAVEPDARLAAFLGARLVDPRLEIVVASFEDADFGRASFDLVAGATVFHWLDAPRSLRLIHRVLRPGGAVALWWNIFGDPRRRDVFHEATSNLFAGGPTTPSGGGTIKLPYGLDVDARVADLRAGRFTPDQPLVLDWTLTLDRPGVRRLYTTYSNVAALPTDARDALLDGLEDVAEREFGGVVTRNMSTALYIARRD